MEPAGLILLAATCLPLQAAPAPAAAVPGSAELARAARLFELSNPEGARAEVESAIAAFFAARADARDAADEKVLREAGALAYKLRALPSARRAWDAVRRHRETTLAPDSLELLNARGNVAWLGEQMGLLDEARALEEAILAALLRSQPADHESIVIARANLGDTLLALDQPQRALELFRAAVEVRRAKLGPEHPARARAELDLACGLAATGAHAEAEEVLRAVLSAAPADAQLNRVRGVADLVLVRAVHGSPEGFRDAARALADELDRARAANAALGPREAEARAWELAPFEDLMLSAAEGLGVRPYDAALLERAARRAAVVDGPHAALRRVERTRVTTASGTVRAVTEIVLLAAVLDARGGARWIDLGPREPIARLVEERHAAACATPVDDAAAGAALARIARDVFAPLARALGSPDELRVALDDVLWALPLHALDVRAADGRRSAVVAVLPRVRFGEESGHRPGWVLLGDPSPESEWFPESGSGGAAAASVGTLAAHVAAALAGSRLAAWSEHTDLVPETGSRCVLARLNAASAERDGVVLVTPAWSAPSSVPCLTTPRPVLSSTSLAALMVREDVVGGSSPADLCGLVFAGHGQPAQADGRVRAAVRASDLREQRVAAASRRLVLVAPRTRDTAERIARDVEALARALVESGYTDVCLALEPLPDPARSTLPAAFEAALPRAAPTAGERAPGAWLRVRGD